MELIDELRKWWGWTGLNPVEVVGENDFGNLIVKDRDGRYWRLCPEDGYCRVVASNRTQLDALSTDQEFLHDWYMRDLVAIAAKKCGPLSEGRKYCLKIPGYLGGEYKVHNLASVSLIELVRFSGDLARQTRDLPDGSKVRLNIVD